jgi:signal peptidase II
MPRGFSSKEINIFCFLFVLLSDQISKYVIVKTMALGESRYVFPFFNIVMVENKGITFGILNGKIHSSILIFISFVVIVYLLIWVRKNLSHLLPMVFVVSGALGNIIDRITYGAVIDFLDFHLLGYHWPAFNIADSFIVIGAFVLLFISYGEKT